MPSSEALFDLFSFGRRGSGRRDHLTRTDLAQISRTVRRTPEVMVKVLSRGAQTVGAVRRHLDYIGRKGALDLETDEGETLKGRDAGERLVEDWDLDLDTDRRGAGLASTWQRSPRLVHKILLSMPPGTQAQGVLEAARNFAREEFGLKHRYALALHTDEPHPHIHLVVKAISEHGVRLNIRKATLREWRREFARQLRAVGIPANATDRAVRGENRAHKLDGIYRAAQRGDSSHMRQRAEAVARHLSQGREETEPGKTVLMQTRETLRRAWQTVSEILIQDQQPELAQQARRYAQDLPPALTEREWLARDLLHKARPPPQRERPPR